MLIYYKTINTNILGLVEFRLNIHTHNSKTQVT